MRNGGSYSYRSCTPTLGFRYGHERRDSRDGPIQPTKRTNWGAVHRYYCWRMIFRQALYTESMITDDITGAQALVAVPYVLLLISKTANVPQCPGYGRPTRDGARGISWCKQFNLMTSRHERPSQRVHYTLDATVSRW